MQWTDVGLLDQDAVHWIWVAKTRPLLDQDINFASWARDLLSRVVMNRVAT